MELSCNMHECIYLLLRGKCRSLCPKKTSKCKCHDICSPAALTITVNADITYNMLLGRSNHVCACACIFANSLTFTRNPEKQRLGIHQLRMRAGNNPRFFPQHQYLGSSESKIKHTINSFPQLSPGPDPLSVCRLEQTFAVPS